MKAAIPNPIKKNKFNLLLAEEKKTYFVLINVIYLSES